MKIAFVTTCKGRLNHLSLTLPQNLKDHNIGDYVFVVLGYGDGSALSQYIQHEHRDDLNRGRLVYYDNPEPTQFKMAHAKNQAHRCGIMEGADVLVNLDADNWTGNNFAHYLTSKFETAQEDREAIFLGTRANHRGPGNLTRVKTPPGCFGRIAVTADAFRHAGGYDEMFSSWSPDDKDFAARVGYLGYSWHQINPAFLGAIKHGAGLRFREYQMPPSMSADEFDETDILKDRAQLGVVNQGDIGTGIVYRNFSPAPIELKPIPTRVFGIGLHKTATTSLARAFRLLGYDTAHWESPHWARYIWQEMKETGRSRTLEMHYALCDLPIPLLYQELDKTYPGSKFILTERDEDDWINSIRVHWQALRASWDADVFSNEIHRELYGTTEFDETVFRARYRRHNQEVKDYFGGRDDLLVLTIRPDTSMRELCQFLDVPILDRNFPHKHKSVSQAKYQHVQNQP